MWDWVVGELNLLRMLVLCLDGCGKLVAGDVAYANRPHTGVPEIGQFAYATSPYTHGHALPVVAEQYIQATTGSAQPWQPHGWAFVSRPISGTPV
jgi:hypothetical protein